MTRSLMCFGISCGNGWFQIIDDLSAKLEGLIRRYQYQVPARWLPEAMQVKEKFAGLRFYMDGKETREIRAAIREAEARADVTCETCGAGNAKSVQLHGGMGWWFKMCKNCHKNKRKPTG